MDQRALAHRLGSAEPEELERLIATPTLEEERTLREYLGDEQFEDLHGQAAEIHASPAEEALRPRKGNIVIIPGIMGSYLSAYAGGVRKDLVWPDPIHLARRSLAVLRLGDDGISGYLPEYDLQASGLVQFVYLRLTLALRWKGWKVSRFWFDWRKDLGQAADELRQHVLLVHGADTPIHIVAHSMGGLAARTFIKKYRPLWEGMWDEENDGRAGGRLVMLGTPNHGAFGVPQLLCGLGMVKLLAAVNPWHEIPDLLSITNSFVGPYQMLPSPRISEEWRPLYDSETYSDLSVSRDVPQHRLDVGLVHHGLLADVVTPERLIYVAGYGRKTQTGIKDYTKLHLLEEGYHTTLEGDGTVPHQLGFLEADGKPVATYFVGASHMNLPRDGRVIGALEDLLETGNTQSLGTEAPTLALEATSGGISESTLPEQELRERRVRDLAEAIRVREAQPSPEDTLVREERELTEILMSSF